MQNPLIGYWNGSGLERGDTVLLHSSMKRAFRFLISRKVEPTPNLVIDSIFDQIGEEGTVLFPLFNFDFTKTRNFSMISTPSQMGLVTEFARQNYKGFRTGHPIYSFFAVGSKAECFKNLNNLSGYGSDSPFAKLIDIGGKIASVDLDDQNSMTMYHHVEEMLGVEYRYFKKFQGNYENLNGVTVPAEYLLFVRNLEQGVKTDVNRMGEILWRENLYNGNRPGQGNGMRVILAERLFDRTAKEITEGRALQTLYSIEKSE